VLGREAAGTGLEAGRVGGIQLVQQEGDEALGGVCGQFRREVIIVHRSYVGLSLERRSLHPERYAFTRVFRRSVFIEAGALTMLEIARVH